MSRLPLSVLDVSFVTQGHSSADALDVSRAREQKDLSPKKYRIGIKRGTNLRLAEFEGEEAGLVEV